MRMDQLGPLRVGEILDVALKIYRERFGTLVRAVAVVVIPIAVLVALVQISIPADPLATAPAADPFAFDPGADPFAPETDPFAEVDGGAIAAWVAGGLVVALLSWFATALAIAACFAIVSAAYLDKETSWRQSLRFATGRLRSLIWFYTVYGVLLILAFLALVVPGVYLSVAWAVGVPVLLFEDVRGRKALGRSRQLLKGRWWATAAVLVLVAILTFIVQFAINGVLMGVFAVGGGEIVDTVASGLANVVSSMLTTPFAAAATAVLYFDALVRKEGFDLAQLAEGVGLAPPADERGRSAAGPPPGPPPDGDAPPSWPPPPDWRPSA
ncbi:MAG: hypothetical protein KY412_07395 [Actinobacteria bacterium]|nr:hypothetical protein [Actinomycetota bacterium]